MPAAPSDFFKTDRTASEIKAELLPRFFEVWTATILQQPDKPLAPIPFIDLQAGLDRRGLGIGIDNKREQEQAENGYEQCSFCEWQIRMGVVGIIWCVRIANPLCVYIRIAHASAPGPDERGGSLFGWQVRMGIWVIHIMLEN